MAGSRGNPQRLELKKEVFGQLDELAAADAILASNSSSYASRLFLDEVHHPERVLNIHFYMPPTQNAVDIMSSGQTDRDVIDFVMTTLPKFGLIPFEARRESTGFIFNRIWAAVKRESLEVVAEGVSTPQEVDRMFQVNTGSPAGPFRLMDKVGLDVVLDIEEHYRSEHPEYPEGPRRLLSSYVEQGRLGVKSGAGFYDDYPHRSRAADRRLRPSATRAEVPTDDSISSGRGVAAQCAQQVGNPTPLWLRVIQAAGRIATTIGVLIALYIALIRDPREATEEHQHHVAHSTSIRLTAKESL